MNKYETIIIVTTVVCSMLLIAGAGVSRLVADASTAKAAIAAGLVQDKDGHWIRPEAQEKKP